MRIEMSPRRVFIGLTVIPVAMLAEGLVLQNFKGMAPCPLCVMQRAGFLLIALISLAATIQAPRPRAAAAYFAAIALVAVAGLGVAIRHVWLLHHPKFGCGIDVLEQFVNDLPTAKLMPWLLHASGECTTPQEPILGLQIPEWSVIWYSLFLLVAIIFAFKSLSTARAGAVR